MSENKIKDATRQLAESAKAEMTVDTANGKITLADGWFEKSLPEGLDLKIVKKVQTHNTQAFNALALAVGEMANERVFAENPQLQSVRLDTSLGSDRIGMTFERSVEDNNGVQHGVFSGTYTTAAARTNAEFKEIRQHLSNQAIAAIQEAMSS